MDWSWNVLSRFIWGYSWKRCSVCGNGYYLSLNVIYDDEYSGICGLLCAEQSSLREKIDNGIPEQT